MINMIHPNQGFKVRRQAQLSYLQTQSLTQLYQPIIGGQALSLYLTLHSLPMSDGLWSNQMLHAQILETLNTGINRVDQARIRLEAIGLLKTYRDLHSHSQAQFQRLIYDLQMPYDAYHFFSNPHLSNALFQAIGDQEYSIKIKSWQIDELNLKQFKEITADFSSVYNYLTVNEMADQTIENQNNFLRHQKENNNIMTGTLEFDYNKFRQVLIANNINHQELNQVLKDHVLTCHQLYGLDEVTMAEIVLLSRHPIQEYIQIERIKHIAKKREQTSHFDKKTDAKQSASRHLENKPSKDQQSLKESFPNLSEQEIELISICQQVSNEGFLYNLKKQKQGFATDSELYYVKALAEKSSLDKGVINLLIYYILIILNRDNVFKGELEKIANQWAQNNIENPGQALEFIHREEKAKQVASKNQSQQTKSWSNKKKTGSQYKEIIPAWMKNPKNPVASQKLPSELKFDERAIRDRINRLVGKESEKE